jgi:HNH endonuclease
MPAMRDRRPFLDKVARGKDTDCWPWRGFRKASGHGLTSYKSEPIHASRKAYILTYGPFDARLCVNHRCDNAACCNPKHLYLGTRADNMIDRFGNVLPKYRKATGRNRILTEAQLVELWEMRRDRVPLRECAEKFQVHIATICRYLTPELKQRLENLRADRLGTPRTN